MLLTAMANKGKIAKGKVQWKIVKTYIIMGISDLKRAILLRLYHL